jgi:lipopolysaccharide transport system permease protein
MAGNTLWSFFAACITSTSSTFTSNAYLFGKVYFPRLTVPIATAVFGLISFAIQYLMLIGFSAYYMLIGGIPPLGSSVLLTPLLVLEVLLLGLGFGIIISSLTTKYRDLNVLVSFGVSLWMYATPVVYSSASLPQHWRRVLMLNPMSPIVETFRDIYTGSGNSIPVVYLLISAAVTLLVLCAGVLLFSRVEKTFMDTV